MITLAKGIRIDSSKGLFTPSMKEMASIWQETLLDVVALKDADTEYFWRLHWYFRQPPSDERLLGYRDILRQFWQGDRGLVAAILGELLFDATRHSKTWVVEGPSPESCRIVPDYRIFALSLAFAFNKFRGQLGICENPECKDYFVRPRNTQKFCERKVCLIYGQQKQKRQWWKEHGDEWRRNRAHLKGRPKKRKLK